MSQLKKIAIIGGGIIGMTLANYLDTDKYQVTLFDEPTGQATGASAGIISPWLSKRRNQKWYHLAKDGAAFFPKLIQDFHLNQTIYQKSGTLIIRPAEKLDALIELAEQRKLFAPELGQIERLSEEQTQHALPLLKAVPSVKISGGGRLDGKAYLIHLKHLAEKKGINLITKRVILTEQLEKFDQIILTAGPQLKNLLAPLGYQVDLRPQKGQLLVFDTSVKMSSEYPVAMLDGEADLIPFMNGKILLGATHENNAAWDLEPTKEAFTQLTQSAKKFLIDPDYLFNQPFHYRVGTRAYTSDFAPFFGQLNDQLIVASGLGSSGLTTGPYIGYLLAQYLNTGQKNWAMYQKELSTYIKKEALD